MITLIVTLAFFGFIVWLVTQIPMPPVFKTGIYGVAAFCVILYLLRAFGVGDIPVPRL